MGVFESLKGEMLNSSCIYVDAAFIFKRIIKIITVVNKFDIHFDGVLGFWGIPNARDSSANRPG